MVSPLFFYQLVLIVLVWLCLMLQWAWPSDHAAVCPPAPEPTPPRPKRRREPTPFAGFTHKPLCDACEHATGLCRKVGFWRLNPKIGCQKINDLRVSTFLFSVICDRASHSP
jgi:hypothetical protein